MIDDLRTEIQEELLKTSDFVQSQILKEPYKYMISHGGKRFRPLLTLLTTGIFSGNHIKSKNQAIAMELLHNFTLVHDDIMDRSPLRRGELTIYKKWNDTIAILLGDLVIGIACKVFKNGLDVDIMNSMSIFNESLIEVCMGQAFDLEYSETQNINLNQYWKMIEQKTSSLIRASLLIGGKIGGASEENMIKLNKIGTELGLAFQLQDDLLDLTGNAEVFGKKVGQDLIEGKKTFFIIESNNYYNSSNNRKLLDKFFLNHGIDDVDIDEMIKLISDSGALEKGRNEIHNKFNFIYDTLETLPQNIYNEQLKYLLHSYSERVI